MITTKRIYEKAAPEDGYRVLVDRLWPRGIARESAAIDAWMKDLAPSNDLRRWFGTPEATWPELVRRYRAELARPEAAAGLADLRARARSGTVTLLYAKRNETENNAIILCDVLAGTSR